MARYSPYQRAMLRDSASSLAATRRMEKHSSRMEQHSSAIEKHLYSARQEAAAANHAILRMNSAILAKQDEIAAATRANNGLLAQQLSVQVEQLKLQKQEAERRAQEEAKRDRQAFAIWRQTPDGQAFVQWYAQMNALDEYVRTNDESWRAEVNTVKAQWRRDFAPPVAPRLADPDDIPTARDYGAAPAALFGSAAVLFVVYLIVLGAGVTGAAIAVILLLILGCIGGGIATKVDQRRSQREAQQAHTRWLSTPLTPEQQAERHAYDVAHAAYKQKALDDLGFDPLSDYVPPWTTFNDPFGYIARLHQFATDAFVSHPAESSLPELAEIDLVDRDQFRSPELRSWFPGDEPLPLESPESPQPLRDAEPAQIAPRSEPTETDIAIRVDLSSLPGGYTVGHDVAIIDADGGPHVPLGDLVIGPAGTWIVAGRSWPGHTEPDGDGGIRTSGSTSKLPNDLRRRAENVRTSVSGIIIGVSDGTVENDGFIVDGVPKVIVMAASKVPNLLRLQTGKHGDPTPLLMLVETSPNLHIPDVTITSPNSSGAQGDHD